MDPALRKAKKRVKVKKEFFKELVVYVSMSLLLLFINLFTNAFYMWSLWAIIPWGITLVVKGINIAASRRSKIWEENEIRKELIAMGKDPEDYLDDHLELKELEKEEMIHQRRKGYKDSDLV